MGTPQWEEPDAASYLQGVLGRPEGLGQAGFLLLVPPPQRRLAPLLRRRRALAALLVQHVQIGRRLRPHLPTQACQEAAV